MASTSDPDVPVMLALAGLTYRGFYYRSFWNELHDLAVQRAVADGLADRDVRAAIGEWTLAWGPATRDIEKDFDASAMFVARSAAKPQRLVVAVRGTNPIALTDWIKGNLDVAHPVPWPFRDGAHGDERRVSGSTAFGLNTLLTLKSPAGSYLAWAVEAALSATSQLVPELLADLVRRIHVDHTDILRPLRATLTDLVDVWQSKADRAATEVLRLADEVSSARRTKVVAWPSPVPNGSGGTLVEFLIAEASRAALEITVTGHSKGGALAPALALWLAETRNRWDPRSRARVGCYAFAGPTPGDGAFGRRVAEKLDGPCRRVSNTDDLVTHAWDDGGLASIEQLYGGAFAWLAPVANALRDRLRKYDYEPVGMPTEEFAGTRLPSLNCDLDPVAQAVQQHMDAYLEYTGLRAKRVDTLKLFLGNHWP